MITKILLGLAAVLIVLAVVISLRPSTFRVSRSTTIAASPADIFPQVNNLRNWDAWSPWEKLDPAMKKSFEGPAAGVGAVSSWDGNMQVGAGSNTIVESRANKLIRFKLEMLKPMAGTNDVEFTFQPQGEQTRVTWTMNGQLSYLCKAMHLVMDVDKMCGDQFEKGLADLKSLAETSGKKQLTSAH